MTLGDAVLYQTVIEKLDDVLHCGKTNCLVILFSGAAGIVGLLAFAIYSFKQSKKDRRKQQVHKQNSSTSKKISKSEKKKEEENAKRKVVSKEAKPSPRVEKKKEKEGSVSNTGQKVVHQAPKKAPLSIPSLDQTGETDEWVTVVSRKERKQHQTPRDAEAESPDTKVEKTIVPLSKSKEAPVIEVASKPVLPPTVEEILASLPAVSAPVTHVEKPSKPIANDVKILPVSDIKLLDTKIIKVQAPALSKEVPKEMKVSPPVSVSQPAPVVTKPATVTSPPNKVIAAPKPAVAPSPKVAEQKKLPSTASTAAPKVPAEPTDPEWTEINRSAKKRSRAKKDN
jgi:hypothetical protein